MEEETKPETTEEENLEPLNEEVPVPLVDENAHKKQNLVLKAEIMAKGHFGDTDSGKEDFKGWLTKVVGAKFPLSNNNKVELKAVINGLHILIHAPKPKLSVPGGFSGGAQPPAMVADSVGYFENLQTKSVAQVQTQEDGSQFTTVTDQRVKVAAYGSIITLEEAEKVVADMKKNGQRVPVWHEYKKDNNYMATVVNTHRASRRLLLKKDEYEKLSDKGR